ncbi:hypothetical protein JOC77_001724 [Peribacillus deserti]|uniref:Uncharacterized protein n=1 Tax=Peribacillus deserti TaxID=673318 RepID=A0ABS2QHJ7_9BACI|nr:hypothetical protein [Peribacillus deserti]MBM7692294.1 hypothetical protein [Peribacillus deserti]
MNARSKKCGEKYDLLSKINELFFKINEPCSKKYEPIFRIIEIMSGALINRVMTSMLGRKYLEK